MSALSSMIGLMPRKQLSPDEKKKGIAAKVAPSIEQQLRDIATEEGRSMSQVVERMLRVALEVTAGTYRASKPRPPRR